MEYRSWLKRQCQVCIGSGTSKATGSDPYSEKRSVPWFIIGVLDCFHQYLMSYHALCTTLEAWQRARLYPPSLATSAQPGIRSLQRLSSIRFGGLCAQCGARCLQRLDLGLNLPPEMSPPLGKLCLAEDLQ